MRDKDKPIFAADSVVDDASDEDTALYAADPNSDIVTADEIKETFKITGKLLGGFALAAFAAIIVLYAAASATVGSMIHLTGSQWVWTERDAWEGGNPEIGTNVTAKIESPAATNPLGKMAEGFNFTSEAAVFEITAGPYGEVKINQEQNVIYQGEDLGIKANINSRILDKEYLGECLAGACEQGQYYYIPNTYIIGEAEQYVG